MRLRMSHFDVVLKGAIWRMSFRRASRIRESALESIVKALPKMRKVIFRELKFV